MVRVGDEAGADAEYGERVDLEVGEGRLARQQQVWLADGDLGRVLLVDVEVLDDSLAHEIGELALALHKPYKTQIHLT